MGDLIIMIVVAFAAAITLLVAVTIFNSIPAGTLITGEWLSIGKASMEAFDMMFIFIAIGIGAAGIIGSYLLDLHPIFYIFSLMVMVIIMVIVPMLSNSFAGIALSDQMASATNDMDLTYLVMTNMPIIVAVIGLAMIIALYAKIKSGGPQ